jgi:nucleoside-diphosphate-sugar epimerase
MKALVTGGGGFLGLYITEQLIARGDDVLVFCRGDYPRLHELGVEIQRGDIRDKEAVAAACSGCDVVFHTAAIPGVWGPWSLYYEINTVGTEHVIAGCQQQGVQKLVYTSSPSVVFGNAPHEAADETLPYPTEYACHYPHTKALAEKAVLAANGERGLATCALRPHLIWGPRDNHLVPRLIQRARSGRLRRVGAGNNLVSMTYVENTAHAHLQAADALAAESAVAGQAYFINEPEPVNLWQWIDQLLALVDLPPVKRSVSTKMAFRIGGALEKLYRLLRLSGEPAMTRFLAAQLSSSHYYSTEKARRDFGYAPQVTFQEGMQRLQRDLVSKKS